MLDFYHLFLDDSANVKPALFLEDGVHPNSQGHREMAAMAAVELKTSFYALMKAG